MAALTDPARYPHPTTSVKHLETHISHILLAGDYAYKIKKPLSLGFLDFSSLAQRKFYCAEELRLNRRLAPELYLDCIPISGTAENPILGGDAQQAIEYAVKMQRFPQNALLDRCLDRLQPTHIDALARQLAAFHGAIARVTTDSPLGSPGSIQQAALDNFKHSRRLLSDPQDLDRLDALEHWTTASYQRLEAMLQRRQQEGFIRECHGDLHLGNIILQDEQITIFDCIEFNEAFRWIDVLSDLAFLCMDLRHRGATMLSWRLLNTYLEFSGDYQGLALLSYYLVYRAMVRAKIDAIRLGQDHIDIPGQVRADCRAYLDLARDLSRQPDPFLIITHGVSGSGKSTLSSRLLEHLGAIRIRSDVERKRLFGLAPLAASESALHQGIYTAEAGIRTYQRLQMLAEQILEAGYPVLVDATFLEADRRREFRDLAAARRIPFILLSCTADPALLRARVSQRQAEGDDAAEADLKVLEQQLRHYIPPVAEENPLQTEGKNIDTLKRAIRARIASAR